MSGTSAWVVGGLSLADPFVAVLAGLVLVVAGLALWTELVVRELAVYVVVLMLPLVFCAMVWPARRLWALRVAEVLVALILAKFAIIVPLALGAAALAHGGAGSGVGRVIAGLALVGIGCLAPWVLLRLIPLAEVAAAAVGHVRGQIHAHAGVPTPEAAIAGKVAQRVKGSPPARQQHSEIHELLHSMVRRAQQTEQADPAETETPVAANPARSSAGDPANGSRTSDGPGDRRREAATISSGQPARHGPPADGTTRSAQDVTASAAAAAADAPQEIRRPAREGSSVGAESARGADGEGPTMVQRPDGGWEPMRFGDPNAPVPPPPWEQENTPTSAPEGPPATTPDAGPHPPAPPDQQPDNSAPEPGGQQSGGGA